MNMIIKSIPVWRSCHTGILYIVALSKIHTEWNLKLNYPDIKRILNDVGKVEIQYIVDIASHNLKRAYFG